MAKKKTMEIESIPNIDKIEKYFGLTKMFRENHNSINLKLENH